MTLKEIQDAIALPKTEETPPQTAENNKTSLKKMTGEIMNDKRALAINRLLRENNNRISDRGTVLDVLGNILWREAVPLGAAVKHSPFLGVDVHTGYAGPYAEDASLIDEMTVAVWYGAHFKGEGNNFSRTIQNREYRFARGFWALFAVLSQTDDWFRFFACIPLRELFGALGSENVRVTGRDGTPVVEDITVGGLLKLVEPNFRGWDPGACSVEEYREKVLDGCAVMMSFMTAIVRGCFDIEARMDFYKKHSKAELARLLEREREERKFKALSRAG